MDTVTRSKKDAFAASSVPVNYAKYLAPVLFEPWADTLLDLVHVDQGQAVADIACGTGVATRKAAVKVGAAGRVVGCDVSTTMLEEAEQTAAPSGAAQIEYVLSSADALQLPDDQFDVLLCQQGLQFFDDRNAAAAEMHRVLSPEG